MNQIRSAGSGLQTKDSTPIELITQQSRFETIVDLALKQDRVAVDLESNGFYHYTEKICLLQLAFHNQAYLIDTLLLKNFKPLATLFTNNRIEKIFHSADYDIRSLDRDWGIRIHNLFDTSIASAFIGADKRGLASVLAEYLNLNITKDKKLQRADWSQRPLSDVLIKYAAEDVLYLDDLRETLVTQLSRLGRAKWVVEECKRLSEIKYNLPDTQWSFLSVKGSRSLDGRGLAILNSLHKFRDAEAQKRDLPPFKILSDEVLVTLSCNPYSNLAEIKGIGRYGKGSNASDAHKAIQNGLVSPMINRPRTRTIDSIKPKFRQRDNVKERLRLLKKWRTEQARNLKLDAGLIWPANNLEQLAKRTDGFEEEIRSGDVRHWQRNLLSESILSFIDSIN